MEGEHTPTIIRWILSTNHALIQLKNSCFILRLPNIYQSSQVMNSDCYAMTYTCVFHFSSKFSRNYS